MNIESIDHFVINTKDYEACRHFYVDILGMRDESSGGRHSFAFGNQKINVHTVKGEFQPAASNPGYGTQDFCLVSRDDPESIRKEFVNAGVSVAEGVVKRHGARGDMRSVYVYDPDGNLVEIAVYDE